MPRHFIRLLPIDLSNPSCAEDPTSAEIDIRNRAGGQPCRFPAREIVDGGFLELVRYGVRRADDPLVVDSVRVIDKVLKVETPNGACWRRYNQDGYGQRADFLRDFRGDTIHPSTTDILNELGMLEDFLDGTDQSFRKMAQPRIVVHRRCRARNVTRRRRRHQLGDPSLRCY